MDKKQASSDTIVVSWGSDPDCQLTDGTVSVSYVVCSGLDHDQEQEQEQEQEVTSIRRDNPFENRSPEANAKLEGSADLIHLGKTLKPGSFGGGGSMPYEVTKGTGTFEREQPSHRKDQLSPITPFRMGSDNRCSSSPTCSNACTRICLVDAFQSPAAKATKALPLDTMPEILKPPQTPL